MKIQALFKTYTGNIVSVYALYNDGVLVVGKINNADTMNDEMDMTLSDDKGVNPDTVFREENINQAINYYYILEKNNAIIIDNSLARADPKNAVEFEGVENGKRSYRIKPDIKNEQMAVLAISFIIGGYNVGNDALELFDELLDIGEDLSDEELLLQGIGVTI